MPPTGKQYFGAVNLVPESQTEDLTPKKALTVDGNGDVYESPINAIIAEYLGWRSPQSYYADGVTTTEAFEQCLLENQGVFIFDEYDVDIDVLEVQSNQFIFSNNATIRNSGTAGNILYSDNADSWQIGGKLTIEGGGNVAGTQRGIFIEGRSYFNIENITFKSIAGNPVEVIDGTTGGFDGLGLFNNIYSIDCYGSVLFGTGAEYHTVNNIEATGCSTVPLKILAGNVKILGGSIVYNENGIYVGGTFGTNNSHGIIQNLQCNHNTNTGGYNAFFENVEVGESIRDCHFFGDATNNIRITGSKGVSFDGCTVYGKIEITDATPANNWNTIFSNCLFDPTITTFSGNLQNKREYNNYYLIGEYPNNDGDSGKANLVGNNDFTGNGVQNFDGRVSIGNDVTAYGSNFPLVVSNNAAESLEFITGGTGILMQWFNRVAAAPTVANFTASEFNFTGVIKVEEATDSDSPVPLWQVNEILGDRAIFNLTNVPFTLASINALYPDAINCDRIVCPKIGTGTIYTKGGSDWIITTGTLLT